MAKNETNNRLIDANPMPEDELERSLRPKTLAEFTGQAGVRSNLSVFIKAAKKRGESLDHVLLFGPPGLGKTTLAQIISREMEVGFRATSGPVITKNGDLAAILTNLQPHDVLFIDEIHRLNPNVEEVLYSAMEDFKLDIMIGEGPAARSIRLDLAPFTLVGATTRSGLLTQPLRERFGIPLRLQFYELEELTTIVRRAAKLLQFGLTECGAVEIARRSRGTPRVAGRLLRRVRDFASILEDGALEDGMPHGEKNIGEEFLVDHKIAMESLNRLEVDPLGLDAQDIRYLRTIIDYYKGGPVGIETLAAALSEQRDTLEETIEPYLIQQGFIQRTPRGRVLTEIAYRHLGI